MIVAYVNSCKNKENRRLHILYIIENLNDNYTEDYNVSLLSVGNLKIKNLDLTAGFLCALRL